MAARRMSAAIRDGDCIVLPDGRVARVREMLGDRIRVRVRRRTSDTHQFLIVPLREVRLVACPAGWMSPDGYRRYLKTTLAKMRARQREARAAVPRGPSKR